MGITFALAFIGIGIFLFLHGWYFSAPRMVFLVGKDNAPGYQEYALTGRDNTVVVLSDDKGTAYSVVHYRPVDGTTRFGDTWITEPEDVTGFWGNIENPRVALALLERLWNENIDNKIDVSKTYVKQVRG